MALQASSASPRVLADNPHGASVLMDRPPRRHEAGAVKAGTAAALITDHERKAVSIRAPYFHVLDATDDADELHGRSIHGAPPIREAPRPERKANPESWRRCGASPKGDGFLSKSVGLFAQGPHAVRQSSEPNACQSHWRGIGRLFGKGICSAVGGSLTPTDACNSGACLRIAAAARSKTAFASSSALER
jgi:hypothetical protein